MYTHRYAAYTHSGHGVYTLGLLVYTQRVLCIHRLLSVYTHWPALVHGVRVAYTLFDVYTQLKTDIVYTPLPTGVYTRWATFVHELIVAYTQHDLRVYTQPATGFISVYTRLLVYT